MLISHLPGSDTVPVAFNVPSVTHHRQRFGARDEIGSSYGEAEQVIVQPHACHTTSAVQLFSNIPQNLLLRFLTSCLPHPLKGFITKVCEVTFTFFQNLTETETVFVVVGGTTDLRDPLRDRRSAGTWMSLKKTPKPYLYFFYRSCALLSEVSLSQTKLLSLLSLLSSELLWFSSPVRDIYFLSRPMLAEE